MERASRILVFVALFGILYFVFNKMKGGGQELQPILHPTVLTAPQKDAPEQICDLWTKEYRARISSRGAVLKHFEPLSAKYKKHDVQLDLVTTPDHARVSPLFTSLVSGESKEPSDTFLVTSDLQEFKLVHASPSECRFEYEDDRVRIEKTFKADSGPYGLAVGLVIENVGAQPRSYALTTSTSSYLKNADVESKMFRTNPLTTRVECVGGDGSVKRSGVEDFDASDFEDKERFVRNDLNPGDWSEMPGVASLTAVSNAYFTNAISHDAGPATPVCQTQIEDRWNPKQFASKSDDPNAAAFYKARLRYAPRILAPGKSETFQFKAFVGPKEREALAAAGDRFDPLIDLGFFSIVAKVLVAFLLKVHSVIPNWGVAIVILTITARVLLFPLSVPSIKNMIHMRELKPEMDRLNEKYKDDPQAKGLAQMELWKKHGVNPMKGCLPQLASMPVWFALYTTLQTAVELYNIPFLWFPDLSESDPYYILPFIIGGVFFLQQKLMPMQADPAQQKTMMYMMPAMFTVFMLFLPAGLGVYMFTNSLLGIVQQQLVEKQAKKSLDERRAQIAAGATETKITETKAKRSS